jgi:hypothetical protein
MRHCANIVAGLSREAIAALVRFERRLFFEQRARRDAEAVERFRRLACFERPLEMAAGLRP